jgi:hypothetical protein
MVRIVDCQRNLARDQREEIDLFLRKGVRLPAADAKAPKPAVGGSQRKRNQRSNAFAPEKSSDPREASLPVEKRNDQRLLLFVEPGCQRFLRLEIRRA